MKKIIISISLLAIGIVCYAVNIDTTKDINRAPKNKNYELTIPTVSSLDSRTSLVRNEINIIDNKKFDNLSKFKKILRKEINTIGLQYNETWIKNLQDVANEIKKHPNTIVIVEGFRKTELSERENIELSKEHALFVASVLRDIYQVKNTMAAIGRGTEKNENFIYNCVIISLIKDINPSDII